MKNINNILLTIIATVLVSIFCCYGCSSTTYTNTTTNPSRDALSDVSSPPPPPRNIDAAINTTSHNKADSSTPAKSILSKGTIPTKHKVITNTSRIEEDRVNGKVTEIKVRNRGNMPDYYIYPSPQQDMNINNQPDRNMSTPTWQIRW